MTTARARAGDWSRRRSAARPSNNSRAFVVKEVKRVGNEYHVAARITLPGANAEAWQRVFTQPNTKTLGSWLRLVDGAGKTIARGRGGIVGDRCAVGR